MKFGPDEATRAMARANPVPNPRSLIATMERSDVFLTNLEARKHPMDTKLESRARTASKRPRPRAWLVAAAAAVIIVAVVGASALLTGNGESTGPETPREIADAFIQARNDGDAGAAIALFAEGVRIIDDPVRDVSSYPDFVAWLDAVGWKFKLTDCTEGAPTLAGASTRLTCGYEHSNAWSRAQGFDPFDEGGKLAFEIGDGAILSYANSWKETTFSPNVWEPFVAWVALNHQDQLTEILSDACCTPSMDPDARSVWATLSAEYAREVSG